MKRRILLIGGDGIGPEVIAQARRALDAAAGLHGLELSYDEAKLGGVQRCSSKISAPADSR